VTWVGFRCVHRRDCCVNDGSVWRRKVGSSYGNQSIFNGLLQLAGPPICGPFSNKTGRLEPIIIGLGISLFLVRLSGYLHRSLKDTGLKGSK